MHMLGRAACAVCAAYGILWFAAVAFTLPSCGTTTSVSGPYGGAGPTVVLDGGGEIPAPPDGVALCPTGACNYQSGLGCGAGSACRPQFTAASPSVSPGCEPAGSGVVGGACTAQSQCAAGYYCAEGSCRKQCCAGDWSACDAGESCIRQVDVHAGNQIVDSGLALCFPVNDCEPLDTSPCKSAPNRECKIVDPTGAVACAPLSSAHEGDDCGPTAACAAGLSCVLDACRKLCRAVAAGGEPACTPDEGTCIHFNRDPEGVGECTFGR
jgi:hypothetical protein